MQRDSLALRQCAGFTGESNQDLTAEARELEGRLGTLRMSAKPLTSGFFSPRGRGTVRGWLVVLLACDHDARGLTRVSASARDRVTQNEMRRAIAGVAANLDAVAGAIDSGRVDTVEPAHDLLDATQTAIYVEA